MRYPTPYVETIKPGLAHSFPFMVGYQTLEILQTSLFFIIVQDVAAGYAFKLPNGVQSIQDEMAKIGYSNDLINEGWGLVEKYNTIVNNTTYQNNIVNSVAQWDWFIKMLGRFIKFGRSELGLNKLDSDSEKHLSNLHKGTINQQLRTLNKALLNKIDYPSEKIEILNELFLIRNLGLHNRWACDEDYLIKSKHSSKWEKDQIRIIGIAELELMNKELRNLVRILTNAIAVEFKSVPEYIY